jgi:hypothetical protein
MGFLLPTKIILACQGPTLSEIRPPCPPSPKGHCAWMTVILSCAASAEPCHPNHAIPEGGDPAGERFCFMHLAIKHLPFTVREQGGARGVWAGSGDECDPASAPGDHPHAGHITSEALGISPAALPDIAAGRQHLVRHVYPAPEAVPLYRFRRLIDVVYGERGQQHPFSWVHLSGRGLLKHIHGRHLEVGPLRAQAFGRGQRARAEPHRQGGDARRSLCGMLGTCACWNFQQTAPGARWVFTMVPELTHVPLCLPGSFLNRSVVVRSDENRGAHFSAQPQECIQVGLPVTHGNDLGIAEPWLCVRKRFTPSITLLFFKRGGISMRVAGC